MTAHLTDRQREALEQVRRHVQHALERCCTFQGPDGGQARIALVDARAIILDLLAGRTAPKEVK